MVSRQPRHAREFSVRGRGTGRHWAHPSPTPANKKRMRAHTLISRTRLRHKSYIHGYMGSGMRHTRDTHTREMRHTTTPLSARRGHPNMVNSKRYMNKLPASRAGKKRHFRRYFPPPPAVVILPRAGPRCCLGAAGVAAQVLKRRRGCSRSQPRGARPCPRPLPPWPAPGWGEGQVEGYGGA